MFDQQRWRIILIMLLLYFHKIKLALNICLIRETLVTWTFVGF
jgi:hypothetical protein